MLYRTLLKDELYFLNKWMNVYNGCYLKILFPLEKYGTTIFNDHRFWIFILKTLRPQTAKLQLSVISFHKN